MKSRKLTLKKEALDELSRGDLHGLAGGYVGDASLINVQCDVVIIAATHNTCRASCGGDCCSAGYCSAGITCCGPTYTCTRMM